MQLVVWGYGKQKIILRICIHVYWTQDKGTSFFFCLISHVFIVCLEIMKLKKTIAMCYILSAIPLPLLWDLSLYSTLEDP